MLEVKNQSGYRGVASFIGYSFLVWDASSKGFSVLELLTGAVALCEKP